MKHKLFNFIKKAYDFIDTIGQDKVGIYTAQASFFIILSIFPFILLFFNLIGHASINQNTIIYLIHSYAPDSLKPLFRLLVKYMNMYQVLLCPLQPLLQYGQHLKACCL